MKRRWTTAALVTLALAGCGEDSPAPTLTTVPTSTTAPTSTTTAPSTSSTAPPVATVPVTTVPTLPPISDSTSPTPAGLSLDAACKGFYKLVAAATLTDAESASAFGALARQTADPSLATAIQNVADRFAAPHPAGVLTGDVTMLCPPSRYLGTP